MTQWLNPGTKIGISGSRFAQIGDNLAVNSIHLDDEKKPWKLTVSGAQASGDDRARTDNPRLAKPVLSQLSYVPKFKLPPSLIFQSII